MSHTYTKEEVIQFCRNHLAVADFYDKLIEQFKSDKADLADWLYHVGSWGRFYVEPFETFSLKLFSLMGTDAQKILPDPKAFSHTKFDINDLEQQVSNMSLEEHHEPLFILTMFAMQGHIRALEIHNRSMDVLIYQMVNGNDESLFKAILVDPAVLTAQPVQSRIAKAVLLGEDGFFKELSKALTKTKPRRPREKFDPIRSLIGILDEVHALDGFTQNEVCKIFIDHLDLYPHDGGDPYSALKKSIKDWRSQAGK